MVISAKVSMLCAPEGGMGSALSAASLDSWESWVREADFGGFRLFAHTIFGGENFRVGGDLELYNSKIDSTLFMKRRKVFI
jgi:hypothetical protein